MRRSLRHQLFAVAVLAGVALLVFKRSPTVAVPSTGRSNEGRREIRSAVNPSILRETILPQAAAQDRPLLEAAMRGEPLAPIPGIPSGPFTVEGAGGEPDGLPDLDLTESQRTLVDALISERRAVLEGVRRETEKGALAREDAVGLSRKATEAHLGCLAAIRSSLLPDQRIRFDSLVESGRWGRYSFVIPVR